MITVNPAASFEAVATGFQTGLTGTIGVRILDNAGATSVARTTSGIGEYPAGSGIYYVTLTAPSVGGQFTIMWDDGNVANNATEDLLVTSSAPSIVASSTSYVDLATLKGTLNMTGETYADNDISMAVSAASRAIDNACDRRFWADADATSIRYYTPNDGWRLAIDDLVTLTSLKVDTSMDGTFATTLTVNTGFVLEPLNAAAESPAWPYTRVKILPNSGSYFIAYPRSVQITGKFGWATVPYPITEATTILAAKLLRRAREAPFGVLAVGIDQGAVMRIAIQDPDVRYLIEPYRRLLGQ